jgi:hypothetical protein
MVRLEQDTSYPWSGRVEITVKPEKPCAFALHIRIPGWVDGRPVPSDLYVTRGECDKAGIAVNGQSADTSKRVSGYCVIERMWQPGDKVTIEFPMPVQRVYAHQNVEADRGRVALMRGPLLYCLESCDHKEDLDAIVISDGARLIAERRRDLLSEVIVIRSEDGSITAVPFYAWNNREPGRMTVWIRQA